MEIYPVTVTIDGKTHKGCKMIADGTGTSIYQWDRTQKTGVLILATTFTAEGGPRRWVIRDDDGETPDIEIVKASGCGCAQPLKRWRPGSGAARVAAG